MTHYQKLATMIFRILGIVTLVSGLILIIMRFVYLPSGSLLMVFVIFLPYLIGGLLSFALSQFLAKVVCYDLDKFDEQK